MTADLLKPDAPISCALCAVSTTHRGQSRDHPCEPLALEQASCSNERHRYCYPNLDTQAFAQWAAKAGFHPLARFSGPGRCGGGALMETVMLTGLGFLGVSVLLKGAVYQLQRRAERRAQRLELRRRMLDVLDRGIREVR